MPSERKYLYLIVTKFPFKGGEPFLSEELKYLCEAFSKVYIIVPEGHRIPDKTVHATLPENAEVFVFSTQPGFSDKLKAFASIFSKAFLMERKAIAELYGQKFSMFHVKTWLGFLSMARCFEAQLLDIMKRQKHQASETSLYSYWFFYATAGLALIKNRNKDYKAVTRIHGWDCFFERSAGDYLPARPYVFESIDGIWPISQAGFAYTQKKLGSRFKQKLHLSYLGIKDIDFEPKQKQDSAKLNLVSIAFIDPVKQLERIVDALALIIDINICWSHIGTAQNGNNQLQNYAHQKLGNKKNIKCDFVGSLTQQQVYEFLASGKQDVLICTSLSEGLPVSMMEAMAHGIPVISVNVGGISEIVEDGSNGYLLPANADSSSIASSLMNYFLESKEKKLLLSQNAIAIYKKKFRSSKNYQGFIHEALK